MSETARRALLVEIDDCLERAFAHCGKGSGRIVERIDALVAAVRSERPVWNALWEAQRRTDFAAGMNAGVRGWQSSDPLGEAAVDKAFAAYLQGE